MKELSIEQKAQAYDDAIKRVEDIKTGKCETRFMFTEGLFEHIFPELKESEDERIRKEILAFIHRKKILGSVNAEELGKSNSWIAWLEKQGEKDEEILILKDQIESLHAAIKAVKETHRIELEKQGEHTKFCNSIQIGDKVTRNQDGVLVNLSQLDRVAKKQGEKKLYVNDNAKEMFIKALERVEEQNAKGYKLTDCDKNSWWEDFKTYTSRTIEQKTADKVEQLKKRYL